MGNPMIIGMALGAGAGALTNKDPLKGALMGGALGAAGGSFAGGFGSLPGSTGSFLPYVPGNSMAQVSQSAAPTFMQRLSAGGSGLMGDVGSLNQLIKQNPTTSQIGFGLAKSAFEPDQPMPYAPQVQISRGPVGQMDYMSLLNPQNQTVIRPQPISLLG